MNRQQKEERRQVKRLTGKAAKARYEAKRRHEKMCLLMTRVAVKKVPAHE